MVAGVETPVGVYPGYGAVGDLLTDFRLRNNVIIGEIKY